MTKKFNLHSRKKDQEVLDFHIKESLPWLNFKFSYFFCILSASSPQLLCPTFHWIFQLTMNSNLNLFLFYCKNFMLFYPKLSKCQPFYVNFPSFPPISLKPDYVSLILRWRLFCWINGKSYFEEKKIRQGRINLDSLINNVANNVLSD